MGQYWRERRTKVHQAWPESEKGKISLSRSKWTERNVINIIFSLLNCHFSFSVALRLDCYYHYSEQRWKTEKTFQNYTNFVPAFLWQWKLMSRRYPYRGLIEAMKMNFFPFLSLFCVAIKMKLTCQKTFINSSARCCWNHESISGCVKLRSLEVCQKKRKEQKAESSLVIVKFKWLVISGDKYSNLLTFQSILNFGVNMMTKWCQNMAQTNL